MAVRTRGIDSAGAPQLRGELLDADVRSRPRRVWRWITPSVPLLPIFGLYILVAVSINTAANDESSYLDAARYFSHLIGGQTYKSVDFLWHGPALPALLAPLVALHVPVEVIRIFVGPIFLFVVVLVFHRLTRLYVRSARMALFTTYSLGVYLPFFTTIGHIHVEVTAALWATLAAFFMVRAIREDTRDYLWAAVALALLALSRTEYGYVLMAAIVIALGWLLVSRRSLTARKSLAATAVALLLCTPWLAYTYSVASKPFYWGDSGGLQLYWMSAPGNIGDWHTQQEAFTVPELAGDRKQVAQVDQLKRTSRDARWEHLAIENIRYSPTHYLSNVVFNIGRLLFNSPYSYANQEAVGTSPGWGLMIYAVPNAIMLGLLAITGFVAIRMRRRLLPEIAPIAGFIALAFVVHIPVSAYGRFLIPLVPLTLWLVIAVLSRHVQVRSDPDPDLMGTKALP